MSYRYFVLFLKFLKVLENPGQGVKAMKEAFSVDYLYIFGNISIHFYLNLVNFDSI